MTNGEKIKEIFPNAKIECGLYGISGIPLVCLDLGTKCDVHEMSFVKDWWNAPYKEPSSSENRTSRLEKKCPCYYCEHFEIKGLSHCKIHEDAYGDSRCNDYHKINQKTNKSEIPTGSTTKDDLALIHTWGLDEEIRCIMCTNHMKSNRGCDGSCVVNKDMYNAVMDAIEKRIQSNTVEAIPKTEYEARLKADMVAMLENLDLQIDELVAYNLEVAKVQRLIRDKIDKLKENNNETDKSNK